MRLLPWVTLLMAVAPALADESPPVATSSAEASFRIAESPGPNPWSHLDFQRAPEDFRFAIVSDLTGGYREGVFPEAVAKLNLLHPEFVISVGDLIEGIGLERAGVRAEWDRFQAMLAPLRAPFFYVAGNHDYGTAAMNAAWAEHLGRSYYHFAYRNVLFLVLNTEDSQARIPPELAEGYAEYARLKEVDPERARAFGRALMQQIDYDGSMPGGFSEAQVDYAQTAIRQNADVRWTLVFMHQPLWQGEGSPQLAVIEEALSGRPHTVFAGHVHNYKHFDRNGRDFIRLGTTGGAWSTFPGSVNNFDHVTLVTMTDAGPVIANLRLDGIIDKYGYPEPAEGDGGDAAADSSR